MSSPILDSRRADLASARDILARLERYAAAYRSAAPASRDGVPLRRPLAPAATAVVDDFQPHDVRRRRLDPKTADLFPYDLFASIVGCALTVLAFLALAGPIAIGTTIGLLGAGATARRRHWYASAGTNLVIGVVAGLIFVITA